MSTLPVLSGREVVRVFVTLGWEIARQRGSHVILVKQGQLATLLSLTIARWPGERCAPCFAERP